MKVLLLTPYLPYPPSSGGQVRSYNLLKQLYKKHDITLFCYIRSNEEKKYIPELEKYCKKVKVFKRRKAWHPLNVFMSGVTPYPFLVSIYISPAFQKAISTELKNEQYDLIHSETFYVMPNIPKTDVPIFLVEQTIEYLVYQRFVEMLPLYLLPLKPLLLLDVFKIKWWEKYFWNKAKRLAAMSQEDKEFMERMDSKLNVDVIANGVDVSHFEKTKRNLSSNPTILFVGQFRWLPNKDAAKFLVREIWPIIREKYSNAKLWIVGRNPTPDILNLEKTEGVKVDGGVEDIRDAYSRSNVLLAPIRNGRGTKYKILEAMATKTPIVGTQLAVEGIDVRQGRDVLIAEDARGLAKLTIDILEDPALGKKLAESSYKLVKDEYNWEAIADELDRVYKEVARE